LKGKKVKRQKGKKNLNRFAPPFQAILSLVLTPLGFFYLFYFFTFLVLPIKK